MIDLKAAAKQLCESLPCLQVNLLRFNAFYPAYPEYDLANLAPLFVIVSQVLSETILENTSEIPE